MEPRNSIEYRCIRPEDSSGLVALLKQIRPSLMSLKGERVYKAVVLDGIRSGQMLIVVAVSGSTVVGYSIIVLRWALFKRTFVLRHPRVGWSIVWNRMGRRLARRSRHSVVNRKAEDHQVADVAKAPVDGPSWHDAAPGIAKVMHTGVAPTFRGHGVGTGLKACYVHRLRQRGFHRVDAHIDLKNGPSIGLNRKSGWTIVRDGTALFSYLELDGGRGPQ